MGPGHRHNFPACAAQRTHGQETVQTRWPGSVFPKDQVAPSAIAPNAVSGDHRHGLPVRDQSTVLARKEQAIAANGLFAAIRWRERHRYVKQLDFSRIVAFGWS